MVSYSDDISFLRASELQRMLLQRGADPSRPCVGGNLDGRVLFDDMVCGGLLQVYSDPPSL